MVCDSPFEVTVAKLRGIRDGRLRTAPAGAAKFFLVPGVGANCIRPPDGPRQGRMIRRRGTGVRVAVAESFYFRRRFRGTGHLNQILIRES